MAAAAARTGSEREWAELCTCLRARRKAVADRLGQAPETLVGERTLLEIATLRPPSMAEMAQVRAAVAERMHAGSQEQLNSISSAEHQRSANAEMPARCPVTQKLCHTRRCLA